MRKMSYLVAGVVWVASTAGLAGGEPQVTQAHGVPRSGVVAPQAGKLGPSAAPALNGATEDPCAALTPAAIQAAIDRMDQARAEAQLEYDAFSAGAYPAATSQGLAYITEAMGQMVFLQGWLRDHSLDTPFVSNTTAAYNTHGYAGSASAVLWYGEHWSSISAVYNHSLHGKAAAELAAQATALLTDLRAHGLSCYMHGYFP